MVGKLLLGIHVLYISHYAITFVYCLYVVGAECMTTGKIENVLIDIIIAMLSLSYVCLSGKARNIFVNYMNPENHHDDESFIGLCE